MPDKIPLVYTRFTDGFGEVAWGCALASAFEVSSQLTALEAEAGAKGATIAVNVALIYPALFDEEPSEEETDNGKKE